MLRLSRFAVLAALLFLPVMARAGPDCVAYRDLSAIPGLGNAPVAVDFHGRVILVDTAHGRVLRAASARSGVLHELGRPGTFIRPVDVAVGPDGSIFVADAGSFRIQKFTPQGKLDRVFGGNGGMGPGEFRDITAIDLDASGNLYILDDGSHRVTSYNRDGMLLDSWQLPDRTEVAGGERRRPADDVAIPLAAGTYFARAADLSLDPEGKLVILFPDEARVGRFDRGGHLMNAWGEPGEGPGRFRNPVGLDACGASGLVYVSDTGNSCVQLFTGNGKYVGVWRNIDRKQDTFVTRMKIPSQSDLDGTVVVASDLARPARPVVDHLGRMHVLDPDCGALTSFAFAECPNRASISLMRLGCDAVIDPQGVQNIHLVIPGTAVFAADRLAGGEVRLPDGTAPLRTWVSDMTVRTYERGHCIVRGPDGIPDLGIEIPGKALVAEAGVEEFGETGTYTFLGYLDNGTPFWGTGAVRGGEPDEWIPAHRRPGEDVARLAYELEAATPVTVQVFSVTGRLVETVVSEVQPAGAHEAAWDGADRPSGIYFLRVRAGDLDRVRKVVVRN